MNKTLTATLLAAATATVAMTVPDAAFAQPSSAAMFVDPAAPAAPAKREGYRTQIALVGVGSLGLAIAGAAVNSEALLFGGVAGLTLGSPLVHAANGNNRVGLKSLGLHLLLPGATTAVGLLAALALRPAPPEDAFEDNAVGWAFLGATVGLGAGIIGSYVYDFMRASKPVAPKPGERMVAPAVVPRDGGATFGVVGSF